MTNVSCYIIWACFRPRRSPKPSSCCKNIDRPYRLLVSKKGMQWISKKMYLVSFGPGLTISACPNPRLPSSWCQLYIEPKNYQLVQKKCDGFKKKTYLGPKQRILRRLGSFLLLPSTQTYLVLSKQTQNLKIISQYKKTRQIQKNTPRAQTTCFVSFGPVIVIATHPNPRCRIKSYMEPKYQQLVQQKTRQIKKQRTFGPVLTVSANPNPRRGVKYIQNLKIISQYQKNVIEY